MGEPDRTEPATPSLRQTAARGVLWMSAQTLTAKVVGFGAQIVLALLLLKADFGLLGLASTTYALASICIQTGLQQILVRRQKHFRRWQSAATWFALSVGLVGIAFTAVAAPVAAFVYGEPRIIPLLLVQSLMLPAISVNSIAAAKLQIDMRFKLAALIGVYTAIFSSLLSITFAYFKFGAYSIVLAQLVAAYTNAALCWRFAGLHPSRKLHFRRWKYFLGDSWWLTGTNLMTTFVSQGDYFILGITQSTEIVGIYYFAYNLSTQAMQLVTVNLGGVLLPVLAKFKARDPIQIARFLEATEIMAYFGVPLCLLQAMMVRPLLETIYAHKWDAAIVPLQLLSLAMIPVILGGHSSTLLAAQGRFRSCFFFALSAAAIFLTVVGTASLLGAAAAVATGVIVAYTLLSAMGMIWATGPTSANIGRLSSIAFQAVLLGTTVAAAIYAIARVVAGQTGSYNLVYALIVAVGFPLGYGIMLRLVKPVIWDTVLRKTILR